VEQWKDSAAGLLLLLSQPFADECRAYFSAHEWNLIKAIAYLGSFGTESPTVCNPWATSPGSKPMAHFTPDDPTQVTREKNR
jgi:hypothetical protein